MLGLPITFSNIEVTDIGFNFACVELANVIFEHDWIQFRTFSNCEIFFKKSETFEKVYIQLGKDNMDIFFAKKEGDIPVQVKAFTSFEKHEPVPTFA